MEILKKVEFWQSQRFFLINLRIWVPICIGFMFSKAFSPKSFYLILTTHPHIPKNYKWYENWSKIEFRPRLISSVVIFGNFFFWFVIFPPFHNQLFNRTSCCNHFHICETLCIKIVQSKNNQVIFHSWWSFIVDFSENVSCPGIAESICLLLT